MRRSFYHYLMTERNRKAKTDLQKFAEQVFQDISFPKHSTDYDEISSYLEMESYVENMTVFDQAWEMYKEKN